MRTVKTSRTLTRGLLYRQRYEAWEPAGDCSAPVQVQARGAPDELLVGLGVESPNPVNVEYNTRCRLCAECLRARAARWYAAAGVELRLAPRTWFGTLTVKPERRVFHQYSAAIRAEQRAAGEWGSFSTAEQFRRIVDSIGPEITLWLKRVRKLSGAKLRYLLVTESHKDGFPHFHLLVHEVEGMVTKRQLDGAWREGFTKFSLVANSDTRAVGYICKYLTKSALTRIRASQRYGTAEPYEAYITEAVERLTRLARPPGGLLAAPRLPSKDVRNEALRSSAGTASSQDTLTE